jgi:hypothetical protein
VLVLSQPRAPAVQAEMLSTDKQDSLVGHAAVDALAERSRLFAVGGSHRGG